jgi:hypothetical protein
MNFIPLHVQFQVSDRKTETEGKVSLYASDTRIPVHQFSVIYRQVPSNDHLGNEAT